MSESRRLSFFERLNRTPKHRLAGWAVLGYGGLVLVGALLGTQILLRARSRWVPGEFVPVVRRGNDVLLPPSRETLSRGVVGIMPLLPNKGHAVLGPPSRAGTLVKRAVQQERGVLPHGSLAWVSTFVYNGTPRQLGVAYEDVAVQTEVGDMPAWHIPALSEEDRPGERDALVIVIHGHGGHKAQGLRALPALRRSGVASLFVTFRNAHGAPRVGRGNLTLGDREAEDLTAALRWAAQAGYKRALLFGFSMGGNIVLSALRPRHGPLPLPVPGVLLDSPALDWLDVARANGRRYHLPAFMAAHMAGVVKWMVTRFGGQNFDSVDQLAAAPTFTRPMLLFHGDRDRTIPVTQSDALAAARPDLVEYHRVEGAKHIRCWNIDPEKYDAAVEGFIGRVLGGVDND
ncbi:prolyl oligopeptidase family serine peptidase [Deinococcus radiomollis]|uniref:alpha/beta hydrolase n=1 Tax=Deinococcus radiomollis TaxID=468916 RepID=UPI003892AF5C